jgi:hypothetical protein
MHCSLFPFKCSVLPITRCSEHLLFPSILCFLWCSRKQPVTFWVSCIAIVGFMHCDSGLFRPSAEVYLCECGSYAREERECAGAKANEAPRQGSGYASCWTSADANRRKSSSAAGLVSCCGWSYSPFCGCLACQLV